MGITMEKVKAAVLGCGVISDIYMKNLTGMFSVIDLVGCCDLNERAARQAAEKYQLPVMTMEQILADEGIRIVVNLTPPAVHYPVIRQLLTGGKHVFTEKPIATTLADAIELAELSERQGVLLASAPETFLGAALQTARCVLDSGMVGQVTSCLAALNRDSALMAEKYPYTAKMGGGIATDVGIYYITALLSLLGPVTEVCGITDTIERNKVYRLYARERFGKSYEVESENLAAGTFRFQNGVVGSLHLNANCIQNEAPQLILYGTQGILYLPDPNQFGGEVRLQLKGQKECVVLPHTHGYPENSRGLGVSEMAWAILRREQPRACKEMAIHGLELLLGMMESSRTKSFYTMTTAFTRPLPLPRGYLGKGYFMSEEEGALSVAAAQEG